MKISIKRQYLGDKSEVYSVWIGDTELHAATERDAWELADKIRKAIDQHTIEIAEVCA